MPLLGTATGSAVLRPGRVASLDRLRGLVLVLMALDHCRDFVAPTGLNPESLDTTSLGLFGVRWVTHFCAPVFLFLAGAGAALADAKGVLLWPFCVRWRQVKAIRTDFWVRYL